MPLEPSSENNCQADGIFSPVAGIMGTLQANEVLKTLLNAEKDLDRNIIIFDSLKTNLEKVRILTNPKCINKC